jgi:protein-S-isoprenylcysteine O-methyltransferase Ste14
VILVSFVVIAFFSTTKDTKVHEGKQSGLVAGFPGVRLTLLPAKIGFEMWQLLYAIAWLACVVYSTVPAFWFMVHPFAERWRKRERSPFMVLVPAWVLMWVIVAAFTWRWHQVELYRGAWPWVLAVVLFACGIYLYSQSGKNFSAKHLGGIPEVRGRSPEQRLVTEGIRSRVRHPVYLAHLCEMLAWSLGTGLAVCWALTAFAVVTGAVMITMEDAELEKRFGESYRSYRSSVPAVLPRFFSSPQI